MSISNNNELKIVNEKFKDNFSIHPNPSKGLFTVDYSISKISEVIIQIMDMNGVLLKEYIKYNNPGNYSEHFDISQLSSGIYLCSIKTSTFTKTIKLIIY
ncbi:MAG: T9SS type A sorting domain-containing protein [Bacteroidota bacterium]|nr:T9SS type A sorting domain-containing protein [Bacteroidota bacterium]